jgi:hypothetical protein
MALEKLDDYYPNYREEIFDGYDIKDFDIYAQGDEKVGSVKNMLVDETDGRFRYFIIDTGFWFFGKKVLLPVGLARIDYDDKRVYAERLTKEQVENLPEFSEDLAINNDYEERVRGIYRPLVATPTPSPLYNADPYDYDQEPYFYDYNDRNLRLYEERLRGKRNRSGADIL